MLRPILTLLICVLGFSLFSQQEIEWASKSKSHKYYQDDRDLPAKNGWFGILGSYEAINRKEVTVYDPENFGKTKTYNLTSGKKKDRDFFGRVRLILAEIYLSMT